MSEVQRTCKIVVCIHDEICISGMRESILGCSVVCGA
jgi:hypothetical protein